MGDFNARIANNQSLQLTDSDKEANNPIWLEEDTNQLWKRSSEDGEGGVSHFGAELLGLCSVFDMVICNGLKSWPKSGCITCKTYNGQSVVDYVICSQNLIAKVLDLKLLFAL